MRLRQNAHRLTRAILALGALLAMLLTGGATVSAQGCGPIGIVTSGSPSYERNPRGWEMPPEAELRRRALGLNEALSASAAVAEVPGDDHWDDRFGAPGVDGEVYALAVIGEDLYVGGQFNRAGGILVNNVARWDGSRWWPLASNGQIGLDGYVLSLGVQDGKLIVGGQIGYAGNRPVNNICQWDPGTKSWSALGEGVSGDLFSFVSAIAVRGSEIYAGGFFQSATSSLAANIARWDGTKWSRLGAGTNDKIFALAFHGNDLYAGGLFTTAGTVDAKYLAKWNGTEWSAVGGGTNKAVHALASTSRYLYVGGVFDRVDTARAQYIARWDPAAAKWDVGFGGVYPRVQIDVVAYVYALSTRGSQVFVGGHFPRAGINGTVDSVSNIALYDETTNRWQHINYGVYTNTRFPTDVNVNVVLATPTSVYIGGDFAYFVSGSATAAALGKLDQGLWVSIGASVNNTVYGIAVDGDDIYVGGSFTSAAAMIARHLVRYNRSTGRWTPVANGMAYTVGQLEKDGDYIYGLTRDGQSLLFRYNVKTNVIDTVATSMNGASRFAVSNGEIWAAGSIGLRKYNEQRRLDQWDTVPGLRRFTAQVIELDGDDIYLGGLFRTTIAPGDTAVNIARWDRTEGRLFSLGGGVSGQVMAIEATSNEVYVGGRFARAGGEPALNFAQWDKIDSRWFPLDSGFNNQVTQIAVTNGEVYAGGSFTASGDIPLRYIARWAGEGWEPLGSGLNQPPGTIRLVDDDVFVGGTFDTAGPFVSYRFGRWNRTVAGVEEHFLPGRTLGAESIVSVAPNPVADRAAIGFTIPGAGRVTISLHDARGERVATLHDGAAEAGEHELAWEPGVLANGLYFVRLEHAGRVVTRPLVLTR